MMMIHEAAEAIRNRSTTPLDLVEACLAQIDLWEKKVHAWVFVDRESALAEARRLTDELDQDQSRGPLHGIPLGIKDIFDVRGWPTAAGFGPWANRIAREDAHVVALLRQAGAIFLGKTVTTQFASFDPSVTRNPWNRDRTPGGSSSGSAAAVATGMCLGAIGSQTGGSITRPASYCGVAGCKPSYGLLSLRGIVPLAPSMDHPGVIARCVRDLAILLANIVPPEEILEADQGLVERSQSKPSLVRLHGLFDDLAEPAVRSAMDATVQRLQQAGITIDDQDLLPSFSDVLARHRTVMAVEAAEYHRPLMEPHPEDYQPNLRQLLQEGLACRAVDYLECKRHQAELSRAMEHHTRGTETNIIYLTPATTSPAPGLGTTGSPAFNSPWSYTGLPTVSVPSGQFVDGLPLALQLIAGPGQENALLAASLWCERALGVKPMSPPLD